MTGQAKAEIKEHMRKVAYLEARKNFHIRSAHTFGDFDAQHVLQHPFAELIADLRRIVAILRGKYEDGYHNSHN